ncbi:MAG: DUF1800 domain-containing protein [Myxococcota bacterium]
MRHGTSWITLSLLFLAGCSGGGTAANGGTGGSGGTGDAEPTTAELEAASRLLSRATFGAAYEEIRSAAILGPEAWVEDQFAQPTTTHVEVSNALIDTFGEDAEDPAAFWRLAWWNATMNAEDQLRQRIAFALSEIFVVSATVEELAEPPPALSIYYDMLLEHAFGNFRDLLTDVTLSPFMGIYLSHVNNARANPARNTFPDENYAREVMQLFSIGLFELNNDGSEKLDGEGMPIPTYDNEDIREFAKVFTGLSFGGPEASFGNREPVLELPMQMFETAHEPGEKRLLGGVVLPAGQPGLTDIDAAIDNLFNHPNVGPFIGRQLIQRLVTSNPSPEYIERVARAFNETPRGDMKRVVRAVLLDPEATAPPGTNDDFGKLREPFVRYVALNRQLNATSEDGETFANLALLVQELTRQHVFTSPSVFNFFSPSFRPSAEFVERDLVGPEFQITTSSGIVAVTNLIAFSILDEPMQIGDGFPGVTLDLSDFQALADDPVALVDRLDLVFTYGTMSDSTKEAIVAAVSVPRDEDDFTDDRRTEVAIYLTLVSPDYATEL